MKTILMITGRGEGATGVILVTCPPIATRLLFGAAISDAGVIMSRIAGIALLGLGVACWPGSDRQRTNGMVTYSTLVMLYLIVAGLRGTAGILLWPAVAVHAIIVVLLAGGRFKERSAL